MTIRRNLQCLLVLLIIITISCSDPREQQLQEFIENKDYSQIMTILNEELTAGNTGILKSPNDQKTGVNDSTLFVRAAKALLFSSTYSASNTGDILLNNKARIGSYTYLLQSVIDQAVANGYYVSNKLDRFIYEVYSDPQNTLDEEYTQKHEQIIRTDSVFVDRIKTSIIREVNTEKNLDRIQTLLELANIEAPKKLFDNIRSTQSRLETAKENSRSSITRRSSLSDRIERLEIKYGSELIRQAKASYTFKGYMVAQLDPIANIFVYEVRDMRANTYVLFTKETRFTTKGFFSLRVVKGGDLTMKTTQSNGGFDANFPSITEVTDEWYNKYLLYTQEVQPLERELRNLRGGTDLFAQEDDLESQLGSQKNELFTWIRSNVRI